MQGGDALVIMSGMNARKPHIALNAHLLSGEASYRSAGIHGYLYNTLAHLPEVAPEFQYTVFTGQGSPPADPALTVRRSTLPTANPLARIVWEQVAAPLALARLQPDLLHGMAFALPLLWRGPSVVTIFDLSFHRHPERLSAARRLYLRTFTRASARQARRVIAISESGRREIHDVLGVPLERIDVAYPGVGPDFKPLPPAAVEAFRRERGLPERFILYLGTLEPRKNLSTLLRAYARLPQRGAVKLILAGGHGWDTEPVFALIEELGLGQDVITPGYLSGNELPLWYNAADLFAYPSIYEGFGMPLVEALACGCPVVASNTTSLPEAVGPAGVLLPPTDVAQWADALARLCDDETARRELAALGKQHAQKFTWTETARQTAEAYHRALSIKGNRT